MNRFRRVVSSLFSAGMMLLSPVGIAGGYGGIEATPAANDCGLKAAYTLLRLEGRPAGRTWSRLADSLPEAPRRGYSMAELRDAIRDCGLGVDGVSLRTGRQPLDGPALVFLRRGDHGHYVVIRPVGQTGRLVQILDPVGEPIVVDAVALYRSPQWTGLALLPRRPARAAWVAVANTALMALLVALPPIRRRWSKARHRLLSERPAR